MGLFNKKKTNTPNENNKKDFTPNPLTCDNNPKDYGFDENLKNAIDAIIPVISNGDLNLIPSVYNAEVLTKSVNDASISDILTLAGYTQKFAQNDQKGDQSFAPTFLNILAGGIGLKIKSANTLYSVFSSALKKPYPLIAFGYATIFFTESDAKAWAEKYQNEHESEVFVKTFSGDEIKEYCELLTALGILTICPEPHTSQLVMHHQPIFETTFETVSHPSLQFFSIRFVQVLRSKILQAQANQAHGAVLSSILSSEFLCPGKTINGKFIVASMQQPESSIILAFTDKRELELVKEDNKAIGEFLETAEVRTLSFKDLEEFLMAPKVEAFCINLAGTGFMVKREVYENLYKAIKENPDKNVTIKVE